MALLDPTNSPMANRTDLAVRGEGLLNSGSFEGAGFLGLFFKDMFPLNSMRELPFHYLEKQ